MTTLDSSRKLPFEFPQILLDRCVAGCVVADKVLLSRPENEHIRNYLGSLVKNADPGSQFAKASKLLKDFPNEQIVKILLDQGYNALVYSSSDQVFGHAAFQIHHDTIHMFSVGVAPVAQGQGCAKTILLDLIEWGRDNPKINQIILGVGGHDGVQRICDYLGNFAAELGLQRIGQSGFQYLK